MLGLFGSGSLGVFSGSFGSGLGGSLSFFLGASLGCALAGSLFALGSFSVYLLSLALFETFSDGTAANVEDELDALVGVVVGGDHVVDGGRV